MESVARRVESFIRRHDLFSTGDLIVVGLSGGVDSVVLASILIELGYAVNAVHVNFRLRGSASDGDEAFVRAWCRERDVGLDVRAFDTEDEADERGESIQEAARTLRYGALEEAAAASGARRVALGHHRDDQAETLLLNLFRGSGPEGLAGMPVRRPIRVGSDVEVVRPLLGLRRYEIETFARRRGFAWREDATNEKSTYRRGALRSEILPLLERHFGEGLVECIARSADLVREYVDQYLDDVLHDAFAATLSEREGKGGAVALDAVRQCAPVIRRRVFIEAVRRWLPGVEADAQTAVDIEGLLSSQPGRRLEYGGGAVWRERERLLFVGEPAEPSEHVESAERIVRLEAGGSIEWPGGRLTAERLPSPPADVTIGSPFHAYLDARAVRFPVVVRPWASGDRFVPLGMTHAKKVSDFLTDEHVASHRKRSVRVVESAGRIAWVVPFRIADHVRIRDDSRDTVHLRFVPRENT